MTVHQFPTGQELADVPRPGDGAVRTRSDGLELCLIAGLIATTAAQAALFVWYWLS